MTPVFSARFRSDLSELYRWLADRNPTRALSFIDEIEDLCRLKIVSTPRIGSRRLQFGENIRAFHSARHNRTIFYRIDEERGTIIFLHLRYNQDTKPEDFKA